MKTLPFAGLIGLAALGAQAQALPSYLNRNQEPVIVTATRGLTTTVSTLRDTVVITREDLENAGPLTLAEVLQRHAGVEIRATGGSGQPVGIFLRGAGAAQTLVLVDGLRVGSATAGTTSIENIPLEMIERIEVVKGAMSSLYGSEAIGGVVQVFTRGRGVPHLFVAGAYGSENDRRGSAGIATVDRNSAFDLSVGARRVDARSATNERVPFGVHDPDRDPHENAFATMRASHRMWQGETIAFEGFYSRSRSAFDGGSPADRSEQSIAGARITSSATFTRWWSSRITAGHGRDELRFEGPFPARYETRQDQASWINEFGTAAGSIVAGAETVRQTVLPDRDGSGAPIFIRNRRDTNSYFASLNESWRGQRMEASIRRDDDDQFGARNTGATSYGSPLTSTIALAATYARGYRAPTFNDLYLTFPGYIPNPGLRPERSVSREISLRSIPGAPAQWRVTAFDNQLEDLIVFSPAAATALNVNRARVRGIEASVDAAWLGIRWRGALTLQRPRDEDTGARLQNRATRFASLEASRAFGAWSASVNVVASGDRFDSIDEASASRLPAYVRVDARVRYAIDKRWSAEVALVNLTDKRYETTLGYDAPRRGVLARIRFDAF